VGHTGRVTGLSRGALAGGQEQIAETQQTYDLIASEFARRNSVAAVEVAERLDELAASVPAGSVVADIGCGPGRDVTVLRARGLHVAGIDLSLGQLRASDIPGLVQADMRHLPLQAGSVDGIWCWAALVHLPREAVPQALAEFARIVRSGGSLSMSIAEGDGEGFEVATPYGSDRRRWFTRYREPELTALLTAAGFSIRNVRRHRAYRDWLSVHAIRQSAEANGLQRQPRYATGHRTRFNQPVHLMIIPGVSSLADLCPQSGDVGRRPRPGRLSTRDSYPAGRSRRVSPGWH
jgi:ubiquinone/menaquinone biosynthesis C-methylase UbiE